MKRRIMLMTVLILFCSCFLFAAERISVSLDTTKIKYLECGFAKGPGPGRDSILNPQQKIETKAIGGGAGGSSYVPATTGEIMTGKKPGGALDIYSDEYTIWLFKIGFPSVSVKITGFPLIHESNKNITPLGYDVYIDQDNPSSLSVPSFSVGSSPAGTTYELMDPALTSKFIQYWETKFMLRVNDLPKDLTNGTYKGSVQLTVQAN